MAATGAGRTCTVREGSEAAPQSWRAVRVRNTSGQLLEVGDPKRDPQKCVPESCMQGPPPAWHPKHSVRTQKSTQREIYQLYLSATCLGHPSGACLGHPFRTEPHSCLPALPPPAEVSTAAPPYSVPAVRQTPVSGHTWQVLLPAPALPPFAAEAQAGSQACLPAAY